MHFSQTRYIPTDGPTDRPTDRPTDTPSYRDARTHLKRRLAVIGLHPPDDNHSEIKKIPRTWTYEALLIFSSGDSYPTDCMPTSPAPSKALKVVRDAFHIYSDTTERIDYIIDNLDKVEGVITVWHGIGKSAYTGARGWYWCVDYQGYEVWMEI